MQTWYSPPPPPKHHRLDSVKVIKPFRGFNVTVGLSWQGVCVCVCVLHCFSPCEETTFVECHLFYRVWRETHTQGTVDSTHTHTHFGAGLKKRNMARLTQSTSVFLATGFVCVCACVCDHSRSICLNITGLGQRVCFHNPPLLPLRKSAFLFTVRGPSNAN